MNLAVWSANISLEITILCSILFISVDSTVWLAYQLLSLIVFVLLLIFPYFVNFQILSTTHFLTSVSQINNKFITNIYLLMEEKLQLYPAQIVQSIVSMNQSNKEDHQHRKEYQQFFIDAPCDSFTEDDLREKLHSNGIITYNKYSDDEFFVLSAKREGINKQILTINVQYGSFSLKIYALLADGNSQMHFLHMLHRRQNTVIYDDCNIFPKSIIKCFSFDLEHFQNVFLSVIRQVCIFKICQALQVGPSLKNICQFDLIIYKNCIQFFMERCTNLSQIDTDKLTQQKLRNLKTKLKRLHSFQIVHTDIKLENICFSLSLNEFVFIDFGISRFTGQNIGEKSLTIFMGTTGYFSNQLGKCKLYQTMKRVDLYYNDVHCLRKAFNKIEKGKLKRQECRLNDSDIIELKGGIQNINTLQNYSLYGEIEQKTRQIFQKITIMNAKYYIKQTYFEEVIKFIQNSYQSNRQTISMHYFQTNLQILSGLSHQSKAVYIRQAKNTKTKMKQKNFSESVQSKAQDRFQNFINFPQGLFLRQEKGIIKKNNLMIASLSLQRSDPLCSLLLDKSRSQSIPKQLYYQHLTQFLNFKKPISTYQQKIEAAKVFLQIIKTEMNDKIDILKQVNQCLFVYYLKENNDSFVREIPIIYGNLIILNINMEQIFQFFTQTVKKPMSLSQYFQVFTRMVVNTYWMLFHNYYLNQLFILVNNLLSLIRTSFPFNKTEVKLSRSNEIKWYQFLHFFKIIYSNQISFLDNQSINQNSKKFLKSCRFIEKQTLNKLYALYYFYSSRYHISHQHNHIGEILNFYSAVCNLDQAIDYYHLYFAVYYRDIACNSELINLVTKLYLCLDNKNLILNNIIYWINIPFNRTATNLQLLYDSRLQYLHSILMKFQNCTKRQSLLFANIFISFHQNQVLKIPRYKKQMKQVYSLSQRLFPILYQSQLQRFLSQFDVKIISIDTQEIKSYHAESLNITYYIQLMLIIHKQNPELDIVRLIKSYIHYLQKKNKNENNPYIINHYSQQIHYNCIRLFEYQNKLKQQIETIISFFAQHSSSGQRLKHIKNFLIHKLIKKLNMNPSSLQQLKQTVDSFVDMAITQFIDNEGFLFFHTNFSSCVTYTFILSWLLFVSNRHQQYCRVIFTLLQFIYRFPIKGNIQFLIYFIENNQIQANIKAQYHFIKKRINITQIKNNPYLIYIYIFLGVKQKCEESQLLQLFKMLRISIDYLHKEIEEIIHQIIFYKIISVDLQFFDSIQNKRRQKQQLFFQFFCRKKYLKNPINQIKMCKFSKLLIRKDYDEHRRTEYKLTKLLKNKLDKYYKIIGNKGNEILRNFPNPFKVQK